MLRPVGSLPPSVYWRRRALVAVVLVLLIVLTVYVLQSGGGSSATPTAATRSTTSSAAPSVAPASAPTSALASTSAAAPAATPPSAATSPATSVASSPAAGVAACVPTSLQVSAATQQATYHVGDEPTLFLQVVNPGPAPCAQDLADSQVELRVFNGESRVWGSHDCQIVPGSATKTLPVGTPVRIGVQWSGLSSQPGCAGTRQRVGAGSYTVYALLAGVQGAPAVFSLS